MAGKRSLAKLSIAVSLALASAVSGQVPNLAPLPAEYGPQVVPIGTPVRLMFLTEINSRKAIKGNRFKLRVDEPVFLNGRIAVPVGATAWGEIVSFDTNGAVGKGGKLGIRILYLDLPSGRLPLHGDAAQRGGGNGAGVAMAVIGFGLLGLFTAGDSARFKAGDSITAYVDAVPNSTQASPAAAVPESASTAGAARPQQ